MKKVSLYITAAIMGLLSLIPFYVLLFLAVSPSNVDLSEGQFLIAHIELSNFTSSWKTSNLGRALINSTIITFFSVSLTVVTSAGAGYVFARIRTFYNKIALHLFLFSMMIPAIVNTVPLYILLRKIGGINSHWAMIMLLTAISIPFATYLYTNFINSMSREIEESAIIDGCTWFAAFWKITFPLLKPITSTVIIMNAVNTWNNYSQSVFFLQSQSVQTVPLAISRFAQTYSTDYTSMAAASVMGMIPSVLVFLILQKHFIKGMAAGALKG